MTMRCPKSKFPIGIIFVSSSNHFFYEFQLIIHVIQGLSLSTASLVLDSCLVKSKIIFDLDFSNFKRFILCGTLAFGLQ